MNDGVPSDPTTSSLLSRFSGENGIANLIELLCRQTLLSGLPEVTREIALAVELLEYPDSTGNDIVITQNGVDNDLYFILTGSVSIEINKRQSATRSANTHIGEMALIDQAARRSATVKVRERTILAKITEARFTEIANNHPKLWRRIAVEIGSRLRERGRNIRPPNNQPVLFIGCSKESLEIAHEIQLAMVHDSITCKIWTDGVFSISETAIESLVKIIDQADFSVLIITPDDVTHSREKTLPTPRDNVVFELGLCMGGIGRHRSFIVKPIRSDVHIPSDLLGLTPIEYNPGPAENISSWIGPVCTQIRRQINEKGPR